MLFYICLSWYDLSSQDHPNVILIVADDLGHKDVSYNNGYIKTPNIDQYQNEGIRFERFYTTAPVCSPTRGAIMTGRISERFGISGANKGKLLQQEINLGEVLLTEGYNTGHFGKWHLGTLTTDLIDGNRGMPGDTSVYSPPWENGFKTSFATENAVPTFDPMKILNSDNQPLDFEDENYYGTAYWVSQDFEKGLRADIENVIGDDNAIIIDQALGFIENSVDDEKAFFCNVWFHTPHLPVVPREDYRNLYTDDEWDQIDEFDQPFVNAISSMDFEIGRLFKFLEQKGVLDNTIIWFMSDNGPTGSRPDAVGDFKGRKNTIYEGGVRVPSFFHYGPLNQNSILQEPVSTLDVLPTIYELVTDKIYESSLPVDGTSLVPVLTNQNTFCRKRPIFCMKDGLKWKAIFEDDYKLICHNEVVWELYDLKNDPSETNNLITSNEDVFTKMRETILEYESHICKDLDYMKSDCSSSLPQDEETFTLSIFPNPAKEKLFIDLNTCQAGGSIRIFNTKGTEIENFRVKTAQKVEIDLSNFLPATYIVRVTNASGKAIVSKFISLAN